MKNNIGIVITENGRTCDEFLLEGLNAEQWTMFRDKIVGLILEEGEKHRAPLCRRTRLKLAENKFPNVFTGESIFEQVLSLMPRSELDAGNETRKSVATALRTLLPNLVIYEGGHHVAAARGDDSRRLLMITGTSPDFS